MSVISTLLTITKSASNRTPYFQITHCLMPLKCLMFWQSRKGRNKENSQVNFDGKTILTKSTKSLLGCDKGCYFLVTTLLLNARWVIMYCIMYNLCHWRFFLWLCPLWCASRFRILKEFVWAGKKANAVLRRIIYYEQEHLQTHLSVRPCPKYNLSYAYQKLALIANPSSKSQPLQSPQSLQTKFTLLFVLLLRWLKM